MVGVGVGVGQGVGGDLMRGGGGFAEGLLELLERGGGMELFYG